MVGCAGWTFHDRDNDCSTNALMAMSRRRATSRMRSASSLLQRTRIAVRGPGAMTARLLNTWFSPSYRFILVIKRSSNSTARTITFKTYPLIVRRCFSASVRILPASSFVQRIKSAVRAIRHLPLSRLDRAAPLLAGVLGFTSRGRAAVNVGDDFVSVSVFVSVFAYFDSDQLQAEVVLRTLWKRLHHRHN
jgi:hypothetical protein